MKTRAAKKVVKRNLIRCRSRYNGPEDIVTGGEIEYREGTYRKALNQVIRAYDRKAWNDYEARKKQLLPMDSKEYEQKIREIAEELGI